MISTSHVIIGGTVGLATGQMVHNPLAGAAIGLATGIVSHFVMDCLPHLDTPIDPPVENWQFDQIIWSKRIYTQAIIDSSIAFLLTLILWIKLFHFAFWSPFAWGALGGYLPDFIDLIPLWREKVRMLPILKQMHKFHIWTHNWRFRFPMKRFWPLGIFTQVVIVVPCLWFLLR